MNLNVVKFTAGEVRAARSRPSLLFQFGVIIIIIIIIIISSPIAGLDRPLGFQEVEAPRFLDNLHMKVARLPALRTGRIYPPGNIPGTEAESAPGP
jgi:hypothetical protein